MAYRETVLGGCANIGECKQSALKFLDVDCLVSCINMVGNLSKLERVITAQTKLVESLEPTSVEFRTELEDLNVMISTRDRVLSNK